MQKYNLHSFQYDNINTYNIRGLSDFNKRQQIFQYLSERNYTISLLQETHSSDKISGQWKSEWKEEAFFSGYKSNSNQVSPYL